MNTGLFSIYISIISCWFPTAQIHLRMYLTHFASNAYPVLHTVTKSRECSCDLMLFFIKESYALLIINSILEFIKSVVSFTALIRVSFPLIWSTLTDVKLL